MSNLNFGRPFRTIPTSATVSLSRRSSLPRQAAPKTFSKLWAAMVLSAVMGLWSCTKDVEVPEPVIDPVEDYVCGFYLLNEGQWGSNNATLDYVDLTTGQYISNIFHTANPDMPLQLGDVGNDIFIVDNQLFIVLNGSNLVEIADAATAEHIATVEVPNCRAGIVVDGHLYVTSFGDNGTLYKISLTDYQVVEKIQVGYGPEELCVHNGKIYVVNSCTQIDGSYVYDNRISVVDLDGFTLERHIETEHKNLCKILFVGDLAYVSSLGDYGSDPGAVFTYDPADGSMKTVLNKSVSNWDLAADGTIYTQSTSYDASWNAFADFGKISGAEFSEWTISGLDDISLRACYGLAVNPSTGDVVLTDAGDYSTEGTVHYFGADGTLKWSHVAGVCPSKVCWVYSSDNE